MIWSELHPYLRGLILTGLFVTMCMALCMIPNRFRRRGILTKPLLIVCGIVSFAFVVMLGAGMKASYYGNNQGAVSLWAERLHMVVPVAALLIMNGYLVALLIAEIRYRKNAITPDSIKESLDHLNTGLCFSDENGMVMLANHRMYDLCQQIVGRDLQNAALFWDILRNGTVCADVERLTEGEEPSFRLPDQSVWSFSRSISDGVIQLMAANITKLQSLVDDLVQTNTDLAAQHLRLQEYSKNVDHLARLQERLDTKARIHSQFGQALLATRHFLLSEDETAEPVMEMWEQTTNSLRKVTVFHPGGDSLQTLKNAAQVAGLQLDIHGSLPRHPQTRTLFLYAAMEALTNAVRHADAQCLRFELLEKEDMDIARFANDGKIPATPVTEGGGLSALRRKTELAGGTMTIETRPVFALVLSVPKERRDGF